MKRCMILRALLAFVLFGVATVSGQSETAVKSPRVLAIEKLKEAATSVKAVIEPVRVPYGLAVVVTASTPDAVRKVHEAGKRYVAHRDMHMKTAIGGSPDNVWKAIASRKLTEQVEETSTGLLIIYRSTDDLLVDEVQKGDCDWCVCPAPTVLSCRKCCG